ncbi:hypothetical protein ATANTOWER_030891 [Ataeniobius toweri]|uniref:Uncharacterized protein n=1 Tax=Ataeniobius toweri TaxID=208326 RepID=A0ABU7CDW0_9TELE|nr:hypothetical protein [Ataeniobius toweri]
MDVVHSLTLPIHTLYSQVQVPIPHRDNQPPDPGTSGVRNRNPDKEPESELEPPRSKRCPSPPKANHPPPPQKKTYTNPNIQTTPRTNKTLDTQVESICDDLVPTRYFRRPLRPPMHRRPLGQYRVPEHVPDKTPVTYPA